MSTLTFADPISRPADVTPYMRLQIIRMYQSGYSPEKIARLALVEPFVVRTLVKPA